MSRPGALVAWWDGNDLTLGVVAAFEKRRVRIVTARGHEIRVPEGRLAFELAAGDGAQVSGVEACRAAAERIRAVDERIAGEAARLDVGLVWEVVTDGGERTTSAIPIAELAELALDETGGEARLATARAILADGIHFTRKGDDWDPRPAQSVAELKLQRERVLSRERETRAAFDALRAAARGETFEPVGGETERRYLDALEQLAVAEGNVPDAVRDLALEALEASGLRWERPHEGAFRLLRRVGRFTSDQENLPMRRFGLRERFPDDVLAAARAAVAAGPEETGREDLTGLEVLSIDGAFTREIDDALSLEPIGRDVRLGIHIADASAFVRPDDPVDREAFARGVTYYFPETTLTMIPGDISHGAASLVEGERRPAVSFLVDLDPEGRILDARVRRSWIRSSARLDYDRADRLLAEPEGALGETLAVLGRVARAREALRIEAGAVPIHTPEVDFHVDPSGTIELERLEGGTAARKIVTEAMILAGAIAGRMFSESGLDAIYRRQAPPAEPVEVPAGGIRDRLQARSILRGLKRAGTSLVAGAHHSLGLESYAQVTSPLRRFQDLVNHRQLLARVTGAEPPYDTEAMRRIAATTERAEADARQAERSAREFWALTWFERHTGASLDALVVEEEPRTIVQLEDLLWEQPLKSLRGVEAGEHVRVRVERVVPRAGLLVLRPEE